MTQLDCRYNLFAGMFSGIYPRTWYLDFNLLYIYVFYFIEPISFFSLGPLPDFISIIIYVYHVLPSVHVGIDPKIFYSSISMTVSL